MLSCTSSLSSSFSLCQGGGAARNFFNASSDSLFHAQVVKVILYMVTIYLIVVKLLNQKYNNRNVHPKVSFYVSDVQRSDPPSGT